MTLKTAGTRGVDTGGKKKDRPESCVVAQKSFPPSPSPKLSGANADDQGGEKKKGGGRKKGSMFLRERASLSGTENDLQLKLEGGENKPTPSP